MLIKYLVVDVRILYIYFIFDNIENYFKKVDMECEKIFDVL